jgi:Family of unknown function (DUF6345)
MTGIEWSRMLGGSMGDVLFDIQPTNGGNYIAAGGSGSWDMLDDNGNVVPGYVNQAEAWIVKIDPTGKILWDKLIGGYGYDQAMSIRPTSDGGYVFAGYSNSNDGDFAGKNHGGYDGWVVKLDQYGNKQWQTLLGGSGEDELYSIRETAEKDGYIVTGYTKSVSIQNASMIGPCGNTDIFVAKLNLDGSIAWQDVIGGSDFDSGSSIVPASDGGYILTGYTESTDLPDAINANHGSYDIFLMKLDESGNLQWTKYLGGEGGEATAYGNALQPTQDGGYILIGQSLSSNSDDVTETTHGSADVWVVKLDQAGDIQWQNLLGGTGYDDGTAIQQTPDGEYILTARTTSDSSGDVGPNHGGGDIWVVKLDPTGNLLWQTVLGGSAYEQSTAIQPTSDEGFILAARTDSNMTGNIGLNKGFEDTWLAKLKPRLVVDVLDSDTSAPVPSANVFLHDFSDNEDRNITTVNGRAVFSDLGASNQDKFVNGSVFSVDATATGYRDSTPLNVTFSQDGQRVILNLTPLIASYDKSYSITCIENYDNVCGGPGKTNCSINGSIQECNNFANDLNIAGYKQNFYDKDGDVVAEDFNTNPSYSGHTITESAFHYHSGHGSAIPSDAGLGIKSILLLKGFSIIDYLTNNNQVSASDVEGKWGGSLKWVMLDSCKIFQDDSWHNALGTTHGILGFYTNSEVKTTFPDTFMKYALNKSWTIVSAYKQASIDTYHDPNTIATVITKTSDQYNLDQFPGVGYLAPDSDSNNNTYYIKHWDCRSGIEW